MLCPHDGLFSLLSLSVSRCATRGSFPSKKVLKNKVLLIRGIARVETVEGVPAEYAAAAQRYFAEEQGRAWVEQVRAMSTHMARISVRPTWVGLLDFETRFPSAIEAAMAGS